MTSAVKLPIFEDEDVIGARVKIVGAGDGLSEALKIQPVALHLDDTVYYLVECEIVRVAHETTKDGARIRVHTAKAVNATEVDADVAEKMLTSAAEALESMRAEQSGQLALDAEHVALA